MRLWADECVPGSIVWALRSIHFDVTWGSEAGQGQTDLVRLIHAIDDERIVLTEDFDFIRLLLGSDRPVPGLILYRLPRLRNRRADRILEAIIGAGEISFDEIIIIEPSRIRRVQFDRSS